MSNNIFDYRTQDQINNDPWGALRAAIANNPTEMAVALSDTTGLDFTEDVDDMLQWAQEYYMENGNIEPVVRAAKGVNIIGYSPKANAKSNEQGGATWNWGGFIGGVVQGIGVGLQNGFGALTGTSGATQQQQQALLEAQRARQTRNTILAIVGIIAAVVIGVVLIKKFK